MAMQHDNPYRPYSPTTRTSKSYKNQQASSGGSLETPPRTNSSDLTMPSWTTMAPQTNTANTAVPTASGFEPSPNPSRKSIRPPSFHRSDLVSRHLLVETALLDSAKFELLPIEEVDALKREKAELEARVESTRRKLALESKVRDAAQSLHRLYRDGEDGKGAGTPNGQGSGRRGKGTSLLVEKGRSVSGSTMAQVKAHDKAGDELMVSQKKIDEILGILSGLESRRQYVESRLLRHTAAVLQECHKEREQVDARRGSVASEQGNDRNLVDGTIQAFLNGGVYEESIYSRDRGSFGGLTNGFASSNRQSLDRISNEKVAALQARVDGMNGQMRNLIQLVRREKTSPRSPERRSARPGEDGFTHLETQIELVDKNVARLNEECLKVRDERERTEKQLTEINKQLYLMLQVADSAGDLEAPPTASPHGVQGLLNYLDEAMLSLESALQVSNSSAARDAESARAAASAYETTLHELWESMTDASPTKEAFSLAGLSTRVQHISEKSAHMESQADILRKQIQQQRELNSKSDGEKDRQVQELQSERMRLEAELQELRDKHVTAEAEAHGARGELDRVIGELEGLQSTARMQEGQKHQVFEQLQLANGRVAALQKELEEHKTRMEDVHGEKEQAQSRAEEHEAKVQGLAREVAEAREMHSVASSKLQVKHKEAEDLEAEVVRLTTELTMVKAELDGAYGSRAERAKELANAEIDELRKERDDQAEQIRSLSASAGGASRAQELERELRDMAEDYQEMARESVAVERERESLEALVDGLRERCETLETQLSDEKVRWLGVDSPTQANGEVPGMAPREMTSAMVLRQEFKKMMRETRAESARMLRAEQEERKKLEAMVRQLRREQGASKKVGTPQ